MGKIGAAVLIWSMASAASSQQVQFDLNCEGIRQVEVDGPEAPYSYGIRVDLDEGRWCWSPCERTFEIAEIAPDRLVLLDVSVNSATSRRYTTNEVSRVTGAHRMVAISSRPIVSYIRQEGSCTVQPFSGFPAALF